MYSTKYQVHAKADLGACSIHTGGGKGLGDPYTKPRSKNPADDRYRGKQFEVIKKGAVFSTFKYSTGKPDPYNERIYYKNVSRSNGFGSSDAPKRDEFSNTIAIQQYRAAIKAELSAAKAQALRILQESGVDTNAGDQKLPAAGKEKPEFFEFDQVFTVQHDDDIGKPRAAPTMKLGALRTTTAQYGVGCDVPHKLSKNVRNKSTSQFFNNGHLRVNNDAD